MAACFQETANHIFKKYAIKRTWYVKFDLDLHLGSTDDQLQNLNQITYASTSLPEKLGN